MKKFIVALWAILTPLITQAALTGADACKAGNLAVIRSDVEAVWSIYPQSYSGCYAVSDDGCTLYFASPKEGEITIIAASVNDGKPVIDTHTLYYGVDIPAPTPQPEPKPTPKPETLESQVQDEADCLDNGDLTALAESFETVVDSINRGTVLTKISGLVDNTSLEAVKKDYTRVAKALRECIKPEVKEPEKIPEPAPPPKTNTGGCPNGQCPNYQSGWRLFR